MTKKIENPEKFFHASFAFYNYKRAGVEILRKKGKF